MTNKSYPDGPISGLTDEEVEHQRAIFGSNTNPKSGRSFLKIIIASITEPMFVLLLMASAVYFFVNSLHEAFTMLIALCFVAGISIVQDYRSQRAVKTLNKITQGSATTIRNGSESAVPVEEVVLSDVVLVSEGMIVPADAEIMRSNDFSVNEALMTGESFPVEKRPGEVILKGTQVTRGYCYARVSAIGNKTALSRIGELVRSTEKVRTPLQLEVDHFVRNMVIVGSIAFLFVWFYYTWESGSPLHGLLFGLTMAMSVLPEELPVAFSTFMALGAYRLYRCGVIAKSTRAVETLGSATVIAFDKTGTLTRNLMDVSSVFDLGKQEEIDYAKAGEPSDVLEYAMWSSEANPFDPMEKSVHALFSKYNSGDERPEFRMVKEFPLVSGQPLMTHIFQSSHGVLRIACKGAPETLIDRCSLTLGQKEGILEKARAYAQEGLRVLGVARGNWAGAGLPEDQTKILFEFLGLITFVDPIDERVPGLIRNFRESGVDVIMITGDHPETALAVARRVGIQSDQVITGEHFAGLSESEASKVASQVHVYARVSPVTKVQIIEALIKNRQVVAMTGDGVNDAPALGKSHIGIAPGKRGTEVAKNAADLILSNDDLTGMVDAIFLGRRINQNLRNAFRYIISIHIPIILLVMMPIFLGWLPRELFSPLHVAFLELIMGPTCSIMFENEPVPRRELRNPSRYGSGSLLGRRELWSAFLQGIMITIGCLAIGLYASHSGLGIDLMRTLVFTTLVFSNLFLTFSSRSSKDSIFKTIKRKNPLIPVITSISMLLLALVLYLPAVNSVFQTRPLGGIHLLLCATIGVIVAAGHEISRRVFREGNHDTKIALQVQ